MQAARPLPVVVILDCSWSMRHAEQDILAVLRALRGELDDRTVLRDSLEIALITMGRDGVVLRAGDPEVAPFGFVRGAAFTPPANVVCDGSSELHIALLLAADILERRCRQHAEAGRAIYRPYVAIVSDGDPTDNEGAADDIRWRAPASRVREILGGKVRLEAFVPAGAPCGILAELVGADGIVHAVDPAKIAQVLTAVCSWPIKGARNAAVNATAAVRDDLSRGDAADPA